MKSKIPYTFKIKLPADADYVAPVRKFVADILQVQQFSPKFSFRSEVIVDEICYNAVLYGSQSIDATVDLICSIYSDRVEFQINDEGGNTENMKRLKEVIENKDERFEKEVQHYKSSKGLGLEIVRMLSEKVNLKISKNNVTSIHVIRRREEN